jgi:CrcB protein
MRMFAVVAVGGALGSMARYWLSGFVQRLALPLVSPGLSSGSSPLPWGTFVVNVIGCLVFGVIVSLAEARAAIGPTGRAFLLVGILGGFTTFSSFGFETFQLLRDGQMGLALVNIGGQVVLGLAALWFGYTLARLF